MKKLLMLACTLSVILILPGLASATHFEYLDVVADCDGFSLTTTIDFRYLVNSVDVDYSVVLTDEAGAEVARFDDTVPVVHAVSRTLSLSDVWGADLCGTYHVTASVYLYSEYSENGDDKFDESTLTYEGDFVCECDPPVEEPCHRTPGYWKNHLDMWPQDHLMLGGVDMSQAELYRIMRTPVRGRATIILAYHTIAAKLNVLNGTDDSINDTIAAADDYLASHDMFKRTRHSDKADGLAIKDILADYNEMECHTVCDRYDDDDDDDDMGKAFGATEKATFDGLKSLYR